MIIFFKKKENILDIKNKVFYNDTDRLYKIILYIIKTINV